LWIFVGAGFGKLGACHRMGRDFFARGPASDSELEDHRIGPSLAEARYSGVFARSAPFALLSDSQPRSSPDRDSTMDIRPADNRYPTDR